METLLLIFITCAVFYRLWSVLGSRTGNEKKHDWSINANPETSVGIDADNVVLLTRKQEKQAVDEEETESAEVEMLTPLYEKDPNFNADAFIRGAERAFDQIVMAFAHGDIEKLKPLVTGDVYAKFSNAIEARQQRQETLEVAIESVEAAIIACDVSLSGALLTVQFKSEQMLATVNANGESFDNPAHLTTKVVDTWVFTRAFDSASKIWVLVKTDAKLNK